jgi:hypothetical protein
VKYDDFIRSFICRKAHEFYFRNQPPTLNSVLTAINKDPDLPNFKKATLHVLLREIGFEFAKKCSKAIMIERADIVMWRHEYLVAMNRYRNKGMNVVYTDESWVDTGTAVVKVWKDKTLQTPRQTFLAGLSTGLKPRTARGKRCALVHTGNEDGVLRSAQLVLLCEKNTADAHDEMDGEIYERYFKDLVLPNLPPSSVIVLHPTTAAKL